MPAKRPAAKRAAAPRAKTRPDHTTGKPPTSTFSPRLLAVRDDLDRHMRRLFPDVETRFDHQMHGWRVPRAHRVETWKGTIDPNYLHVYVAERKSGLTLHFWDPTDPYTLRNHQTELGEAGFKVMVGCLNYARRDEFPMANVVDLLKDTRKRFKAEA